MIRIKYDPEHYRLCVEGHAGTDEYGKDLVCAAVSMLTYALEARLEDTPEFCGKTERIDSAPLFIASAAPKLFWGTRCREVYDTIASGLKLLARYYPDSVRYEEVK